MKTARALGLFRQSIFPPSSQRKYDPVWQLHTVPTSCQIAIIACLELVYNQCNQQEEDLQMED